MKRPDEMTNDEIRLELSDIATRLSEHDDDAWPGELYERRQALRQEVASRPPNPAEIETLERELIGLRNRLDEVRRDRPDVSGAGDGGTSAGSGLPEAQAMAFEYDASSGAKALVERIAFIEAMIERARAAGKG